MNMNERMSNEFMICEWLYMYLIIKLKNNNTNEMSDVMIRKLKHVWMSNEHLFLVSKILMNLEFMPRLGRH